MFTRILIFVSAFLIAFQSHAAHEKGTARLDLKNYSSSANAVALQDNKWNEVLGYINSIPMGFFDYSCKNKLILGIDRTVNSVGTVSTSLLSDHGYYAEVIVALFYQKLVGNQLISVNLPCTLKVNYKGETTLSNVNNGSKEIDQDVFTFEQAYQAAAYIYSIKIYNSSNTLISTTNYPANLYLELQSDAERYYDINTSQSNTNPFSGNGQFFIRYYSDATTGNQIELNWERIPGAEEYDLEWVWVDEFSYNYSIAGNTYNNSSWADYPILDFGKNATRVRTDQNSYRISNTFESGYVFFRIRGVGRTLTPSALSSLGNDVLTECYTPWTWDDVSLIPTTYGNLMPAPWTINSIGSSVISGITVGGGLTINSANVPWFISLKAIGTTELAMENGKNWVYKATYAEEGKKKEVVSYFDGSQRNRQTVTINNSDKVAVVGETYYDHVGRASVNALPTPVDDATIKFYQTTVNGKNGFNFNATSPNAPYTKDIFATGSSGACSTTDAGFSTQYGSGRYYSNNNPFINSANAFYSPSKYHPNYAPDAENFPYSKTEYAADNTGRVSRQGGVGSAFTINNQVGVAKHDTRHFYDVPFQEELDRLFGSEIGYSNRFTKTTTIDANGQVSINYSNDEGKVVATALSAAAPSGINAVKNSAGSDLTTTGGVFEVDLLNKASASAVDNAQDNNILQGDALIFNQKITVTAAQNYQFNYTLLGASYSGCRTACYDCVYDLTFDIVDKCGQRPAGFAPITYTLGQIVGTPPSISNTFNTDNTCGNDQVNFSFQQVIPVGSNSLSVALDIGEYTITKKLTVNQSALSSYLTSYLANCGKQLSDFQTAETPNLDYSGCNNTCAQCAAALGNEANYVTNNSPVGTPSQYQIDSLKAEYHQLLDECNEPCRYTSYCDAAYEMMLIDVSPAGQYADFEGQGNTVDPSQYPLSVLNTGNLLSKKNGYSPQTNPRWDRPEHHQKTSTAAFHYYDEDNVTISKIQVTDLGGSVYQPPIVSGAPTTLLSGNVYLVEPQYLANVADFINAWKPSWAKSLVKFHPEYCYYDWCVKNSTSSITAVMNVDTYPIDPNTGNPITNGTPITAPIWTSDDYDSLLVDIDELEDVIPGTSNSNINKVLLPMQYDPYWATTGGYYVAPSNDPASFTAASSNTVAQNQGTGVTPINFSGLSPTLFYPDNVNYKTANNRFWNYKESGLDLYRMAAIISTTIAANLGQSASSLSTLLDQYKQSTGGKGYNTSATTPFTNPADYILQLQNLDERRAAWDFFKTQYLAMKQELQQEAAESYVMNSGCRGCNDCIGNQNFNHYNVPFTIYAQYLWALNFGNLSQYYSTWFKTWFLPIGQYSNNDPQQCNMATESLYMNKMKRFQSVKDAEGLGAGGPNNAQANIYAATGLCPIAYYFQNFLSEMVQPGTGNSLLASNTNLTANAPSFVGDLFKQVTGGNLVAAGTVATYNFVSASGTSLLGTISIGTYGPCSLQVFLSGTPPVSGSNNWANYTGTPVFTMLDFFNLQATSATAFSATLKIKDNATPANIYTMSVTGDISCMTLNGCSFSPPCTINGTGKALKDLFNTLIVNNQFGSSTDVAVGGSAPATGSPYNASFTNGLKPFLETGGAATTWYWKMHSANTYTLSDYSTGTNANNKLKITLTMPSGLTNFNCINAIQNFRIDPANVPGAFIMDAYTNIPPGSTYGTCTSGSFVVTGTVEIGTNLAASPLASLTIGTCSLEMTTCNTSEHQVKRDMQALVLNGSPNGSTFSSMLQSNNQALTNNPLFTLLLRSYLPSTSSYGYTSGSPGTVDPAQNYYWWLKDGANSSNTEIKGWFIQNTSNTAPSSAPSNACQFELKFKNTPSCSTAVITNWTSLSGFTLVSNPTVNNNAYTFKVTAYYSGTGCNTTTGDTLIGITTCLPMRACDVCTLVALGSNNNTPLNTIITIDAFPNNTPNFSLKRSGTSYVQINNPGVTINVGEGKFAITTLSQPRQVFNGGAQPPSCSFSGGNGGTFPITTYGGDVCFNTSPCSWGGVNTSEFVKTFTVPESGVYQILPFVYYNGFGVTDVVSYYIDGNLVQSYAGTANLLNANVNLSTGVPHTLKIVFQHSTNSFHLVNIETIRIKFIAYSPTLIPCVNTTTWPQDTMPTVEYEEPCQQYLQDVVENAAQVKYEHYLDSIKTDFTRNYTKYCMNNAVENLLMKYNNNDYHFTLYYYDQAGNLVRTVPPEGVRMITPASTSNPNIYTLTKQERAAYPTAPTVLTNHILYTTYTYNSLNQLVKQETPDAGISQFYYDNLGRLVVSQNANQTAQSSGSNYYYSYTKYDELGRINEVGKLQTVNLPATYGTGLAAILSSPTFPLNLSYAARTEVTQTFYGDAPNFASIVNASQFTNGFQQNLRGRVASVSIEDTYDGNNLTYNHATHYSYDIHGNVKELIQDNPDMNGSFAAHRYKRLQYEYDLISGKVNRVTYQGPKNGVYSRDMFIHEYQYDADNRITNVYTSRDGYSYDQDAKYYYYLHGPLARTELGQHKVQGLDYAYTLQGWIKGVNSNIVKNTNDPGRDGFDNLKTTNSTNYVHNYTARDAYGYNLNYYTTSSVDDYKPVNASIYSGASTYFLAKVTASFPSYSPLYNGNISAMGTGFLNLDASMTTIPNTGQGIGKYGNYSQLRFFKYDQLNRINSSAAQSNYINTSNQWDYLGSGRDLQYGENFTYCENGNILFANRWNVTNSSSATMDQLQYFYYTKNGLIHSFGSATPADATNKLAYVKDGVAAAANTDDIDNQAGNNYTYDANGNLIGDVLEQIGNITWSVYGKMKTITRSTGSTRKNMDFKYDAMGNRVSKRLYTGTNTEYTTTYYVRDAQGNIMATYEKDYVTSSPAVTLKLSEVDLYGSSRLGNLSPNDLLVTTASGAPPISNIPPHFRQLGDKNYELSNHLGNVIAVVTDRKLQVDAGADGTTDYFMPDILNSSDYYAFGQPYRKYTVANRYRYGFNGKENDPETVGTGEGTQDYGMRIYNPSLGRFLSTDPLTIAYPWYTPYQFGGNKPIKFIDLDGAEEYEGPSVFEKEVVKQKTTNSQELIKAMKKNLVLDREILKLQKENIDKQIEIIKLTETNIRLSDFNGGLSDLISFIPGEGQAFRVLKSGLEIIGGGYFNISSDELRGELENSKSKLNAQVEDYKKTLAKVRDDAVKLAWKEELELIKNTGKGTRPWTPDEIEEMKKTGTVKGYAGHHINDVANHPELAGEPNNIEFLKTGNKNSGGAKKGSEHYNKHNSPDGKRIPKTTGPLMNRKPK